MSIKEVISPERAAARKIEMNKVIDVLKGKKYIPAEVLEKEVHWFYDELSFNDFYFRTTPAETIAQHVVSLFAGKLQYATTGKLELSLDCDVSEDYAMKAVATVPGGENPPCYKIENEIEAKYIANNFCTSSYVTAGTVVEGKPIHCRLYIMTRAKWAKKNASKNDTDLKDIADASMMERCTENTKKIYADLMVEAIDKLTPIIKTFDFSDSSERRIIVAWRQSAAQNYFSEVSHLFSPNGVYSTRKYCEAFANGMRLASFYLAPIDPSKPITQEQWDSLCNDISAAFVLPSRVLGPIGQLDLSRNQEAFMYAAWKFAHQFLNRYDEDYRQLSSLLGNIPGTQPKVLLSNLKRRLRHDTFSEAAVLNAVVGNIELIKEIYDIFSSRFNPAKKHPVGDEFTKIMTALDTKIGKICGSEFDVQVVRAVCAMVRHCMKTNFYRNEKAAICFRLDGKFLPIADYPVTPYAVFFIIGHEFRGFHVRFADIARGGIRVIKSPNRQAFTNNVSSVFDENYNLAYTQQKKNKDIPEGGSKGTILLNMENQDAAEICFEKYVCSLMDVLVPECVQVDYTGRTTPEILFLGPDEYTAELMAWAVDYTKSRKYQVWKAVTTGKPAAYGGVPHDTYGMTTRSVHQYVLGIFEKLGIKEESVKKFQTGGPDGDLGSNEILIAKDTTTAVVDGSGVVYDPAGLDREELKRLAHKRAMVREFNKSKLSAKGFFIDINDKNVTLPDGTLVESGMVYRNNFHLNPLSTTELFVPCGGRPESVNASNLPQILNADGKCKWKYISEGANLFFTQAARLELEKLGVILFKDASANKGGVTSSSKEVTAALALSDDEFQKHMIIRADGTLPDFYKAYVNDIIAIIEKNARDEFECLWHAHEQSGKPFCELTDIISLKINSVADGIGASDLWSNKKLVKNVFKHAVPPTLLELIGMDKFMERVPENYQQAIFNAYLGSQFCYCTPFAKHDDPFALMAFINKFQ